MEHRLPKPKKIYFKHVNEAIWWYKNRKDSMGNPASVRMGKSNVFALWPHEDLQYVIDNNGEWPKHQKF